MSRIERTITRETGEEILIQVQIWMADNAHYAVNVWGRPNINEPYRPKFDWLEVCTPSEIHSVKLELWESLKPKE